MGQVTSLFIRKVLAAVDDQVDKNALLRSVGLDPDSSVDPGQMISATDYYSFLERLTDLDSDPTTIPLRTGAAMRCDDYGAFGLAWKSATDLRRSYARAERYARVLTSVATYEVEPVARGAFMHLHREGPRVTKDHEAYFGCSVLYESDRDALLVSTETLQAPNKLGDESISRFFQMHLDTEISELKDSESLDRQVLNQISRSLSEGVPKVSDVAGGWMKWLS